MANIGGVVHSIPNVIQSYRTFLTYGEGVLAHDFRMTIEGYPDLEFLIQTTQFPELKREPVESFGPHGVQFVQIGRYKNAVDIQMAFRETIQGPFYTALREWVLNKYYLQTILSVVSESDPNSIAPMTLVMDDCWLEIEAVDFSVEDTTLIKPSGTLHANRAHWVGDDMITTQGW